jgi:hypothetical protein
MGLLGGAFRDHAAVTTGNQGSSRRHLLLPARRRGAVRCRAPAAALLTTAAIGERPLPANAPAIASMAAAAVTNTTGHRTAHQLASTRVTTVTQEGLHPQ